MSVEALCLRRQDGVAIPLGAALAAEDEALTEAAEAEGVAPLWAFDRLAEAEVPEDLDDEALATWMEAQEPAWFSAASVRETVRALSGRGALAEALAALDEALAAAEADGVRVHLDVADP
jgi:hypothetical protein